MKFGEKELAGEFIVTDCIVKNYLGDLRHESKSNSILRQKILKEEKVQ